MCLAGLASRENLASLSETPLAALYEWLLQRAAIIVGWGLGDTAHCLSLKSLLLAVEGFWHTPTLRLLSGLN